MQKEYGDRADFITIYISEAHAADEWSLRNETNAELDGKWDVPLPVTMEERLGTANIWAKWLNGSVPYYVDLMDDNARLAYAAWPERLVVLEHGKVAYYGDQGPYGYHPEEVKSWLERRFHDNNSKL